jgi:hypothetical protein
MLKSRKNARKPSTSRKKAAATLGDAIGKSSMARDGARGA